MQVLGAGQDASSAFSLLPGQWAIQMPVHAGGTWILQARQEELREEGGEVWVDTDVEFSEIGIIRFHAPEGIDFRLSGGMKGAVAHVHGVDSLPSGATPVFKKV